MSEIAQTILSTDANLKAYYRFNSGALLTDSSGQGHTLTDHGSVAESSEGKFGYCASLPNPNTTDFFDIADNLDIDGGAITMSCWSKIAAEPASGAIQCFLMQGSATTDVGYLLYYYNNGGTRQIVANRYRSGVGSTTTAFNLNLGTTEWHHLALTYDTATLRLYLDGRLVAGVVASGNGTSNLPSQFNVGNNQGGSTQCLTGLIDDVGVWNRQLSSDEISSLYERGFKKINGMSANPGIKNSTLFGNSSLKAFYRFKEGALTTDDSGNTHTLTAISLPIESSGKYGSGAYFGADDAYSAVDHADFKPTGSFSISCWILCADTSGGTKMIFQSFAYGSNRFAGILFYVDTDGKLYGLTGNDTGNVLGVNDQKIISTATVDNLTWTHVVFVWDTANFYLYINGASAATPVEWTNAPAYQATNYVRVGCQNNVGTNISFFSSSWIDDVAFFNGLALSADQVREIYSGGVKTINGLAIASIDTYNGIY